MPPLNHATRAVRNFRAPDDKPSSLAPRAEALARRLGLSLASLLRHAVHAFLARYTAPMASPLPSLPCPRCGRPCPVEATLPDPQGKPLHQHQCPECIVPWRLGDGPGDVVEMNLAFLSRPGSVQPLDVDTLQPWADPGPPPDSTD